MAFAAGELHAATGTWAAAANNNWDTGAAWLGSNIPNGAGEVANVTLNNGTINTVSLTATRTVGQLIMTGGGSATVQTRYYQLSGSGTLVLDNGVAKPIVKSLNSYMPVNVVLAGNNGFQSTDGSGSIVRLTAANTYTGDTWVYRGALEIANVNALPSFTGNGRTGDILFQDNGAGGNNGTLDLRGNSITINGLGFVASTPGALGTITTASGTPTLTVGDNNATTTFNGIIQNGAGTMSFAKIGTGTQTLGGQNTYTGNTTVSGGELNLADNAKLTFKIGITGTAGTAGVNNWITGTGSLQLNGDFSFDVSTAALVENNSWNIVDMANLSETYGGTFSVLGFANQGGGVWKMQSGVWIWTYDQSTSILSVVPEPSTLVLGLLGGIGMLVVLRRRRA